MSDFHRRQRVYWDSLAEIDPDAAVIDPNDVRGWKNAYLARMRDQTFRRVLEGHGVDPGSTILDVGCGTGSASLPLNALGYRIIGLDISLPLLTKAQRRCDPKLSLFSQVNGQSLPVQAHSVDAAILYGVICYLPDDQEAIALLSDMRRTMKPGSPIVMIEQARRKRLLTEQGLKVQRSIGEWTELLIRSGFASPQSSILRHGRFPTTPLIRAGLLPTRFFEWISNSERMIGNASGIWPWDYADVLFVAEA